MRKAKRNIEISTTQVMHRARALKALRRPLTLTRAGMALERATRAFWPFWSWLFAVWTVLSFGLIGQLSIELAYILTLLGIGGLVGFLIHGIRRFHWPKMEDAADRLDRSLKGRPLTAMWDSQAIGADDTASTGVWRAHVEQMTARAAKAKAVEPDLRISRRDPFGLRYVAATAVVIAVMFGSVNDGSGLRDVLSPQESVAEITGPIYEGWIEPPRYTGLPTIYLNEISGGDRLPVPVGSKVTLRLYGQTDGLAFNESVSGREAVENEGEAETTAQTQLDFFVTQSGAIRLDGAGDDAPNWQIDLIPDTPPMIAVTGPVERTPKGETRLSFRAADDYAVVAGLAIFELDLVAVDRRYGLALAPEPRQRITLDIPLPFTGNTRDFADIMVEDLSKHPWAGLPVTLHLKAFDDLEQEASAEPETIILPGRRFFDPLASAIVEQRRDLLWNRQNGMRVAQILRAVSNIPEDIFDNNDAYLQLRSAITRMEGGLDSSLTDELRDEIAELLWSTALLIEEGDLTDAEARLRRAEERLAEAIENGATEEEIAELTEELRRAMMEYLEQLAREAELNPDQQPDDGDTEWVTSDQLQQMLDRIEELMREGRTEEAQQMLEALREMMENMRTARRQQGEGQGQGQQAMRGLQDILRQQQQLSDDAFRQLQDQFNGQQPPGDRPNSNDQGRGTGENDGNRRDNPPTADDLAGRQEALRELLENQRRGLPDGNTDEGRAAREALRQAEREMGDARDALRQGDLPRALDDQAEALEALREGIENLGREIARNQSQNMGRQGEQAGSPDPNSETDPLGRQTGTMGRIGSEDGLLPSEELAMRSRQLMEEIRRRSGEKSRPRVELDYLERLLDRF